MSAPKQRSPGQAEAARIATQANALKAHGLTLIAVVGRPDARRAILRYSNGRTKTVETGTRIGGGTVARIDVDKLILARDGKALVLAIPG